MLPLFYLAQSPLLSEFFFVLFAELSAINVVKQRLKRDQRAMENIIELLRETEGVIAKKDAWSALERAHFRIRLSRFDIG